MAWQATDSISRHRGSSRLTLWPHHCCLTIAKCWSDSEIPLWYVCLSPSRPACKLSGCMQDRHKHVSKTKVIVRGTNRVWFISTQPDFRSRDQEYSACVILRCAPLLSAAGSVSAKHYWFRADAMVIDVFSILVTPRGRRRAYDVTCRISIITSSLNALMRGAWPGTKNHNFCI